MRRLLGVVAIVLLLVGAGRAEDEPSCGTESASTWSERLRTGGPAHRNDPLTGYGHRLAKHRARAIPVLRWIVEHGGNKAREQAMLVIGAMWPVTRDAEADPALRQGIPMLIRGLEDGNKWVRTRAARSLGRCFYHRKMRRWPVLPWRPEGGPLVRRARDALAPIVRDTFSTAKRESLEALSRLGTHATPLTKQILPALTDPDSQVRSRATRLMVVVEPDADALSALLAAADRYADDPPWGLANALVRHNPDLAKVLPALTGLLANRDESDDAAGAIGRLGPKGAPAIPALDRLVRKGFPQQKRAAVKALGQIGPAARDALPGMRVHLHARNAWDWGTTVLAIWRVDGDTAAALERLRPNLKAPGESMWHHEAVQVAGVMGPKAIALLPLIERDLNHKKSWVRDSVAWACRELRNEPVPEKPLDADETLGRLASDKPWVRGETVEAMAEQRDLPDRLLTAIRGLLADPDYDVRMKAAVAIASLTGDDKAWVPVVKASLKSEDAIERELAIEAKRRIDDLR
jgi:HEAT repeat protein